MSVGLVQKRVLFLYSGSPNSTYSTTVVVAALLEQWIGAFLDAARRYPLGRTEVG
jgi:hypothetical protein